MIPVAKPYLTESEAKAASKVILSGWVTQGPVVENFEKKFAEYVGSKYAVAVSSCTTALHLSLLVAGIKPQDEVICPSMSFIATANSIIHAGAVPVFADVNRTYNIDPKSTEKLINRKTKGILIVHQMGFPADINAFQRLCKKHNLKLIEDAACAAGSSYHGKKIGSHSDMVCFSFHPRKIITTGDGGMITTSNKKYYERLKLLRQHGMSVSDRIRHTSKKAIKEEYLEVGYNYRMTDIQAAIGIEQLKKISWLIKRRTQIAKIYNNAFGNMTGLSIPTVLENCETNWQSYPLLLLKNCSVSRDKLIEYLLNIGISTRRGIMTAHREKAYKAQHKKNNLQESEYLSGNSILLPIFNGLKEKEIYFIISSLKKIIGNKNS